MNYSISTITDLTIGQNLLNMVNQDIDDVNLKVLNYEHDLRARTNSTTDYEADLIAVNAEISSYDTVIASLPEGKQKEAFETKKVHADYRLRTLNQKSDNFGAFYVIDKQIDIGRFQKQLEELILVKGLLETRITELT